MAIIDDVIGVFSPGWKAARLRSRALIMAYEAVKPTRTHKARRENRSADQLSKYGAVSLREQARFLDINHDLVIGVFDKLEERVIGARGIIVEPQPLRKNGEMAAELAADIRRLWAEWSVSPDVTGQYTRPVLERLLLRTWLRDGEVFAQMVSGAGNGLERTAGVPFWLEAMEPDFVPMRTDESAGLNQGVFLDEWGRPKKYLVYKNYPVSGRQSDTKEIAAGKMLHLKFTRRLHQTRGSSMLSGVLMRISALKEYEDAELTAARIAAALGLYIRKGDGQDYEDQGDITPVTGITVTPPTGNVAKGQNITLTVAVQPEGATDKTFRATSANQNFATITVKGNTITVKGVAAGKAQIPVVTGNGEFAAVAEINVTDGAAG
ncbi:TPA: phage portal protein [Escherichia coli]|nr:phage portal protein [Escherichia coli]